MPSSKSSTPTVDQSFDQLSQLAESTGGALYLAKVHARHVITHLENAMKTQEDLTAEIEKAKQAVNDRIAQDQARIDQDEATIATLTKNVEDLKAHPAAADLSPQIDSLEALIASIQQTAPASSTTSDTPTSATTGTTGATSSNGAGATMNLG